MYDGQRLAVELNTPQYHNLFREQMRRNSDYTSLSFLLATFLSLISQTWSHPASLLSSRRLLAPRAQLTVSDDAGTVWTLSGDSEEQIKHLSRSDPLLQKKCPNQASTMTGRDGAVVYTRYLGTFHAPNASVMLASGLHPAISRDIAIANLVSDDGDFTMFVAVDRGPSRQSSLVAYVDWVGEHGIERAGKQMDFALPDSSEPVVPSPVGCSVALHRDWFRTDILGNEEPKGDIPEGAIRTIWMVPGAGSDGLFVFNITYGHGEAAPGSSTPTVTSAIHTTTGAQESQTGSQYTTTTQSTTFTTNIQTSSITAATGGPSAIAATITSLQSNPTSATTEAENSRKFPLAAVLIPVAIVAGILFAVMFWYLRLKRRSARPSPPPISPVLPHPSPFQNTTYANTTTTKSSLLHSSKRRILPTPDDRPESSTITMSHIGSSAVSGDNDTQEGDIIRAAMRAGISPQALFHSLDRMVPDPRDVQSVAPPVYS
ncbi:hypothetical protein BKA62DRAFT_822670 [Auriculariales sp. MPI-PUGE-AT-0066]|nr:hypothetical protein BKA62DRAFT_822670 [Auriculariales sp. MPI-PUGE-AT-0066]